MRILRLISYPCTRRRPSRLRRFLSCDCERQNAREKHHGAHDDHWPDIRARGVLYCSGNVGSHEACDYPPILAPWIKDVESHLQSLSRCTAFGGIATSSPTMPTAAARSGLLIAGPAAVRGRLPVAEAGSIPPRVNSLGHCCGSPISLQVGGLWRQQEKKHRRCARIRSPMLGRSGKFASNREAA